MHIVIAQADEDQPVELYGPFPSALHAADWASNHSAHTREACKVLKLVEPIFYGESL